MFNLKKFNLFILMFPLFLFGQEGITKIETEATYEYNGRYNKQNNHILYSALKLDSNSESLNEISIRIKDMSNGFETVLVNNTFLSDPKFFWIDSSHVFYILSEIKKSDGFFGHSYKHLIKHDVFTHKIDTIESGWYNEGNFIRNIYVSQNKLFYTISKSGEKNGQWIKYSLDSNKAEVILSYSNRLSYKINTCQYLQKDEQMVFIREVKDQREVVILNLLNKDERRLSLIHNLISIESSCLSGDFLYFLGVELPENSSEGLLELENSNYALFSINLNSGTIDRIFTFDKGLEISNISSFVDNKVLLSVMGHVDENMLKIPLELNSGGLVSIEFNPTSYLFILDLDE